VTIKVLLVDENRQRVERIKHELELYDYQVFTVVDVHEDLFSTITDKQPDIAIIDLESSRRDTIESLSRIKSCYPRPMVMLTEHQENIQRLKAYGLEGYAVDGISPKWVRTIIDMTLHNNQQKSNILSELEMAKLKLDQQNTINKAKCFIMEKLKCGENEAYRSMRSYAMNHRHSMVEVANIILAKLS